MPYKKWGSGICPVDSTHTTYWSSNGGNMKAIKNKSKIFCACSIIPGLQGRGKSTYQLTNADLDLMATFEDGLEQFCIVSKARKCNVLGNRGEHSTIAVRFVSYCKRCSGSKWEVVAHPPFESRRSNVPLESRRSNVPPGNTHLIPLPVPRLHITTSQEITDMNYDLEGRLI